MVKLPNNLKLIFFVGLCLAAGALGSVFTTRAIGGWFATLVKPAFSPPNWVFAPVWTTLFILMGIAWYLVNKKKSSQLARANKLFLLQLGLNVLWSVLFFGLHSPSLAFIGIIALWLVIVATIRAFAAISKPAGQLLWPYIAWVSFAAFLNLAIAILNSSFLSSSINL